MIDEAQPQPAHDMATAYRRSIDQRAQLLTAIQEQQNIIQSMLRRLSSGMTKRETLQQQIVRGILKNIAEGV